jgi:hypothetical protein
MIRYGIGAIVAASLLTSTAEAQTGHIALFECRSQKAAIPALPVLKREEDTRIGFRSWQFDPKGQRVFGQPTLLMHYSISHDDEYDNTTYQYTTIVDGNMDHVRWLVERANPDMRCLTNGKSLTCLEAAQIGSSVVKGEPRSISIYASNGLFDDVTEGITVSCSWDKSG